MKAVHVLPGWDIFLLLVSLHPASQWTRNYWKVSTVERLLVVVAATAAVVAAASAADPGAVILCASLCSSTLSSSSSSSSYLARRQRTRRTAVAGTTTVGGSRTHPETDIEEGQATGRAGLYGLLPTFLQESQVSQSLLYFSPPTPTYNTCDRRGRALTSLLACSFQGRFVFTTKFTKNIKWKPDASPRRQCKNRQELVVVNFFPKAVDCA